MVVSIVKVLQRADAINRERFEKLEQQVKKLKEPLRVQRRCLSTFIGLVFGCVLMCVVHLPLVWWLLSFMWDIRRGPVGVAHSPQASFGALMGYSVRLLV